MTRLRHTGRHNVSTMVGMQSSGAYVVTALFVASAGIATVGPAGGSIVAEILALALLSLGALVLIAVPGDPLPRQWTYAVAAIPPVQLAVVLASLGQVPAHTQAVTTTVGSGVALCAFLCVRGRSIEGWAGQVLAFAVFSTLGPGPATAAAVFISCAGVMVAATFFARVVRPASAAIYVLREEQSRQIALAAADDAARSERARQLRRLDGLARPILRRIADTPELDDATRSEAFLIEAELRDSIRARAFDVPDITSAARRARARGVTVQLLDDGGITPSPPILPSDFRAELVQHLHAAESGSLTARIHPPDRPVLATIVVVRGEHTERYEFDATSWSPPRRPASSPKPC